MGELNEYQANLCKEASTALVKAIRALNDADHDLFAVKGMEFHHAIYVQAMSMMGHLAQEYYAASNNTKEKGDE